MFTLSGFADEIDAQLDVQLQVLGGLGIHYLELRGVWGKNVLELDDDELAAVKQGLDGWCRCLGYRLTHRQDRHRCAHGAAPTGL